MRKRSRNELLSFLTKQHLNILTCILLVFSIYFFLSIQPLRERDLSVHPELFTSGEMVTITKVIDGDELRIENASGGTVLRLLGIQSFDPSARDLALSEFGRVCVDFLEEHIGTQAKLVISKKGLDDEGRVLGTLFLKESGEDLALDMVRRGLTLVYRRYTFPMMEDYERKMAESKGAGLGLWASDRMTTRADSMLDNWERERKQAEKKP